MAEAEKDDWLDDLEPAAEKASELDQSDIDALLAGSGDLGGALSASPPAADAEEGLDLDQSAIDALLAGSDSPVSAAPLSAGADSGDLDQSDIDALLAGPKAGGGEGQPAFDADQDEIDKLFADVDSGDQADETPFPAEDTDFTAIFDTPAPSAASAVPDFDAEEFKLDADIPDIPESHDFDFGAPSIFDQSAVAPAEAPAAQVTPAKEAPAAETAKKRPAESSVPAAGKGLALLRNRKVLVGVGAGTAVALLIAAAAFFFKGGGEAKHPTKPAAEVAGQHPGTEHPEPPTAAVPAAGPPPEAPPQPEPSHANAPPTVSDLALTMPADGNQLAITLVGKDPENEPLQYEFQSMPEHGKLSGHAPNLIYIPQADFKGQDQFTVRATDGKNFSAPATVKISKPVPAPLAVLPPPAEKAEPGAAEASVPVAKEPSLPQRGGLTAKDQTYAMGGRQGQIIDWQKLWRAGGNEQAYSREVRVEILTPPRHGSLHPINGRQSVYQPAQGFSGTDTIRYRFALGDRTSKGKTVTVAVHRPNAAPVIHVQPLAPVYSAGDTVVLNASQTQDESRESVAFQWEQLSGVPVLIKSMNNERSQVSFVAPAAFNTVAKPGLVIKLTATDQEGKESSQEIRIATQSRRHSAIWRGRE